MSYFDPPEPEYDDDDLYLMEMRVRDDGCRECDSDYIRSKNDNGTDSIYYEWFENEENHSCLKCSKCGALYDLVEGLFSWREYVSESMHD